jgi:hypothetical protein
MARPTRAQAAAIETAKAPPAFGDRELDFKIDSAISNADKQWHKYMDRRALFQFRDGTYSTSANYKDSDGVTREKAGIKTVAEWYHITSWYENTYLEILLDAPKEPPKPREDGTLSYLSDHFDEAFIGLMQDSPTNPLIRGYIMKKVKAMPEASLDTFDKLKEWIEKTFPIPQARMKLTKGKARPVNVGEPSVTIKFEFQDVETGRARYSVTRYGTDNVEITLDDLREQIENGVSKQELIDELISNQQQGEFPNMEWSDDGPDYEEHDSNDVRDSSANPEMGEKAMIDTIIEFLNQNEPELVDRLEENS